MAKGKIKSLLTAVVSASVAAVIAVAGTMAVLTTKGSNPINVFTSGDIKIAVTEDVDVITKGQGGGSVSVNATGAVYTNVMPGDTLKKEVNVKNTGSNPAFVRVVVIMNNADLINSAIDEVYEKAPYNYSEQKIQEIYDEMFDGFGFNYTKPLVDGEEDGVRLTITDKKPEYVLNVDTTQNIYDYARISRLNWFKSDTEKTQGWAPGYNTGYYSKHMASYERAWAYYIALEPNQSTTLFNGINIPLDFNAEQMAMFENLNIEVYADAIQAASFDGDIETAAKSAFENLEEIHPWASERPIVRTDDDINAAIAAGKDKVILANDVEVDKIDLTSLENGNFTLIANGHSITSPSTATTRAVQIDGSDKEINIIGADITTLQTASDTDSRVIAFNPTSSNMTVNLVDCNIDMASNNWAFAVNMTGGVHDVKLNIENCTIKGGIPVNIWGDNNTITIKNSSLISNYDHPEWDFGATIVQLNDNGATRADNNTVVIENTHFGFDGENGNGDNGVKAIADNGENNKITVTNCSYDDVVTPSFYVAEAEDFTDAITCLEAGDTAEVKLNEDVKVEETVAVPSGAEAVIDLGGKTLSNEETMVIRNQGGDLTLTGEGTVSGGLGGYGVRSDNGTVTVDDGVVIDGGFGAMSLFGNSKAVVNNATLTAQGRTGSSSHLIYAYGSKVELEINGGTYTHEGKGADGSILYVAGGAKVVVNDGTFITNGSSYGPAVSGAGSTLIINGGSFDSGFLDWGGDIIVTGGTFSTNPKTYVDAEKYDIIENTDKTFTVVAK